MSGNLFRVNTLGKGINPLIYLAKGYIVLLQFFYKIIFCIK